MPPFSLADANRVLAIRLDNVGDVVMLGPALRALRETAPQARITLLASPAGSQVAPMLPWVDDVKSVRAAWQDASGNGGHTPGELSALIGWLRERRFDAAFIFTSFSQSPYPPAMTCFLAGIPVRVGQSKEFGGAMLTHWVTPIPDFVHQVDRNLHLLQSVGIESASSRLELAIPVEAHSAADSLLMARGLDPLSPFVAVAPTASCQARMYQASRFGEALRLVMRETGLPAVILGSPRDEQRCADVARIAGGKAVSLAGETSVPELAAVIQRAALVLANDSGPMHIADALARPMVILYSGTELESQWEPRGSQSILLRRETACSPCHLFTCVHNMECLDIPPGEVASAALSLLPVLAGRGAA